MIESKNPEGEFSYLNKNVLEVDACYQRDAIPSKASEISRNWSWLACGAITVVVRGERYFVIDGQHRVLAAIGNKNIVNMPCLVFESPGIALEAEGFIKANSCRKNMSSIDKFKAQIVCGDKDAIFVDHLFNQLGVKISRHARGKKQLKCVAWALRAAKENRKSFVYTMSTVIELCQDDFIPESISDGIFYLHNNLIVDQRMVDRIMKIGRDGLLEATRRAVLFRGAKRKEIWAEGILNEVNKGLRNKYEFTVI